MNEWSELCVKIDFGDLRVGITDARQYIFFVFLHHFPWRDVVVPLQVVHSFAEIADDKRKKDVKGHNP